MAWIELHQSVHRHPKTIEAARLLQRPRHFVVGLLAELWCWALDVAPSGGPLNPRQIKEGASWPGSAEKFVEALASARYLDKHDDGSYWLHNWADYAARLASMRHANKERQRRHRSRISNAASRVTDRDSNGATQPNPTQPNPTQPDLRSSPDLDPSFGTTVPPAAPAPQAKENFRNAPPNQRVARLVDLGDALGFPRNGGRAAGILKAHPNHIAVLDAMSEAFTKARGDPWDYVERLLRNRGYGRNGRTPATAFVPPEDETDEERAARMASIREGF